ncbi:MAG: hypothetical protein IPJ65_38325 [Archangiaceae bacterium]|nr:hypothetical protein [Archangiaceae bacterium]
MSSNPVEFQSHALLKPNSTEASCVRNTDPAALEPLLQAFLLTMTGLLWTVRVEKVPLEDAGDHLRIRALVNLEVPRALVGTVVEESGET